MAGKKTTQWEAKST